MDGRMGGWMAHECGCGCITASKDILGTQKHTESS